jgi:hypothetical protein
LNRAVRAFPIWRSPVGAGAKRTRTGGAILVLEECQSVNGKIKVKAEVEVKVKKIKF